ncbi:MAG: hypothetical protein J5548_12190 [Prevotella sp.]|nr:hypothetical protein [Prevotella sp.]
MTNQDLSTRRSHRKPASEDPFFGLRNFLNIVFMVLAVIGVIVYLVAEDTTIGVYIIIGAIVLKMVECCLRMLH